MKILVVSNMFPSDEFPSYGVFVKNISDGLVERGNRCRIISIGKPCNNFFEKVFLYIRLYFDVFWEIIFHKFDLVYVHFPSHSYPPVLLASLFRCFNIVVNFHGGDGIRQKGRSRFFFKVKKIINQHAIRAARLVVVPSRPYLATLSGLYDFSNAHTLVSASGGVDILQYHSAWRDRVDAPPRNRSDAPLHVAFVGRLVDVKRPLLFARCVRKYFEVFGTTQIVVTVVGNGSLRPMVRSIFDQYSVSFVDTLSQKDLAVFLRDVDVVVQCSESESLGLVLIEAMVSRCLPLCVDNPSYRYLISDSGYLFADEEDFSVALDRLVQTPIEVRADMAEELAVRTIARFNKDTVLDALNDALKRL